MAGGAVMVTTPAMPFRIPQALAAIVMKTSCSLAVLEGLNCKGIHLIPAPMLRKITQINMVVLTLLSNKQQVGMTKTKYVIGPQFVSKEIVPSCQVGKTV